MAVSLHLVVILLVYLHEQLLPLLKHKLSRDIAFISQLVCLEHDLSSASNHVAKAVDQVASLVDEMTVLVCESTIVPQNDEVTVVVDLKVTHNLVQLELWHPLRLLLLELWSTLNRQVVYDVLNQSRGVGLLHLRQLSHLNDLVGVEDLLSRLPEQLSEIGLGSPVDESLLPLVTSVRHVNRLRLSVAVVKVLLVEYGAMDSVNFLLEE